MTEDTGQERLAFIGSLVIFASLLGLVLISLLIEYLLDNSASNCSLFFKVLLKMTSDELFFSRFKHVEKKLIFKLWTIEHFFLKIF